MINREYVDTLLISLEADFDMAASEMPCATRKQAHAVDSLMAAYHKDMKELREALKRLEPSAE